LANDFLRDLRATGPRFRHQLQILEASTERELDKAFATCAQLRAAGLVIANDSFFSARMEQLVALASRYALPTVFQFREFAASGGLMSYGADFADACRQVGLYAGRILKGEKPADLPAQQATKAELIINLKTAKSLGLTVPTALLVRADEVIE
jgi:putative tryptophan/tyrosine transport system substrate-binding protein